VHLENITILPIALALQKIGPFESSLMANAITINSGSNNTNKLMVTNASNPYLIILNRRRYFCELNLTIGNPQK
jgi:hypothetical protein